MEHIIETILNYVEPDGEITGDSLLKQDCGLTSFDTVSLYGELAREYGVPEDLPALRRAKTAKGIWYNNDYSAQNLYLTVKHRLNDNGFEFIFEYRTSENPLEDLKIFYDKMITAIMTGVENPDMTMAEILAKIKL